MSLDDFFFLFVFVSPFLFIWCYSWSSLFWFLLQSIRTGQAFCWLCQGNWANVNCHHCFRYYHHECCLSDGRLATDRLFYRTSDGLQFVSKCNECILIDVIHDRWDKGSEFRKMTPRNIQRLVSLIWSRISCVSVSFSI